MTKRFWIGLGLAASLCAAPALAPAQEGKARYSADELTEILSRGAPATSAAPAPVAPVTAPASVARDTAGPAFTADQLTAILGRAPVGTRSLVAGTGAEPGRPGSGVVPDLQVRFEYNSANLTPDARAQLDELGRALKTDMLRPLRFEVGGHTDAVGSAKYNEWLSGERAKSVASYLQQEHGIEGERLAAQGFGKARLADPANPESGVNRRVEIRRLD